MQKLPNAAPLLSQVDHLVVAASNLDEGVAWCETTLGVTPGPGGEHPLMGTHNRLCSIASAAFPRAYLEIIAIKSGSPHTRKTGASRWFDLDKPGLQAQLANTGPQLIHFVAHTANARAGVRALAALQIDRGELIEASRSTPLGLLRWKIAVRADGQRLFYGALPTLIEWGDVHPATTMAANGVHLQSLRATHPQSAQLRSACSAIGLGRFDIAHDAPNLLATLQTPRGLVTLESRGT